MDKLSQSDQDELIRTMRKRISEGVDHCASVHDRCEENHRYAEAGNQWKAGDVYKQMAKERPVVPWNSIGKVVNSLANREIVERFVAKVFGRTQEDAGIANVLDEACRWQRDISEAEHIESAAVRAMVITGYGVMHKYWDCTAFDGEGMIKDEDVPVWNMLWPLRARQANLVDRKWHICGKIVDEDYLTQIVPDSRKNKKAVAQLTSKATNALVNTSPLNLGKDQGYLTWSVIRNSNWYSVATKEVFLVEMEWLENVYQWKAAVPVALQEVKAFLEQQIPTLTLPADPTQPPDPNQDPNQPPQGQQIDYPTFTSLDPTQQDSILLTILNETQIQKFNSMADLNAQVGDDYQFITGTEFEDYRKLTKAIVKYAIITDDIVWDYGTRPMGYTYEFITGFPYETREGVDFYGVVDFAKGPQDYKNALLSNMLAMYMGSPKQTMVIEQGALENNEEFENKLARPVGIAYVPEGFIKSGRYMTLQAPTYPPMLGELLNLVAPAVEDQFGLSSIDTGSQTDLRRVSGNVVQAAQAAGNVIVAGLFDSIRRYRKRFQLLNIKYIQNAYSPEEIIRIVGQDKAPDMVPPDQWPDIDRFDLKLDEEPVGVTERIDLMDFLTRTGTLDNWIQAGHITFEDALTYFMPQIPESDKRKILEKNNTVQNLNSQLQQCQQQVQLLNAFINSVPDSAVLKKEFVVQQFLAQQIQAMTNPPQSQTMGQPPQPGQPPIQNPNPNPQQQQQPQQQQPQQTPTQQ